VLSASLLEREISALHPVQNIFELAYPTYWIFAIKVWKFKLGAFAKRLSKWILSLTLQIPYPSLLQCSVKSALVCGATTY